MELDSCTPHSAESVGRLFDGPPEEAQCGISRQDWRWTIVPGANLTLLCSLNLISEAFCFYHFWHYALVQERVEMLFGLLKKKKKHLWVFIWPDWRCTSYCVPTVELHNTCPCLPIFSCNDACVSPIITHLHLREFERAVSWGELIVKERGFMLVLLQLITEVMFFVPVHMDSIFLFCPFHHPCGSVMHGRTTISPAVASTDFSHSSRGPAEETQKR